MISFANLRLRPSPTLTTSLTASLLLALISFPAMAAWAQTNTEALPETVSVASDSESGETGSFDFFDGAAPINLEQLREMQDRFAEIAEKVGKATVNVQVGISQGSGVIVSRDGYVMTAAHVIGGANRDATIKVGTREFKAKTLGLNRTIDAGLMKITEAGRFPYLEIGESGTLTPGQWVMAIGHPGGWDEDRGLVYRIGRVLQVTDSLIGSDCSLVGGDSGGPLVDMNGDVIGIHSRIGVRLRDNIHVPADAFTESWEDLASGKDWGRGVGGRNRANEPWMGFTIKRDSLEIERVVPDSPVAKAGLQPGDVLLELNGQKISNAFRLQFLLSQLKPKETAKIKYQRGDEKIEVDVIVGSQAERDDR